MEGQIVAHHFFLIDDEQLPLGQQQGIAVGNPEHLIFILNICDQILAELVGAAKIPLLLVGHCNQPSGIDNPFKRRLIVSLLTQIDFNCGIQEASGPLDILSVSRMNKDHSLLDGDLRRGRQKKPATLQGPEHSFHLKRPYLVPADPLRGHLSVGIFPVPSPKRSEKHGQLSAEQAPVPGSHPGLDSRNMLERAAFRIFPACAAFLPNPVRQLPQRLRLHFKMINALHICQIEIEHLCQRTVLKHKGKDAFAFRQRQTELFWHPLGLLGSGCEHQEKHFAVFDRGRNLPGIVRARWNALGRHPAGNTICLQDFLYPVHPLKIF